MSVPVRATRRIHRKCRGNRFTNQLLLQKLTSCSNSSRGALKMKTINAIILAVVVLFIACAQPPVAPRLNVNVRVLQEEQTSNPDEDPQFEVTPTILPFGLAFTSLDLQVSNAGGGTVDYSITSLPNYLSASSVSGTLSAGEVKKIAVTIDRSKLNSGSHSGSFKVNDETISVSADVAEVVGSKFEVTPTILPFGLAFTSIDLQVSNAGGGTVDYSITGLPNYLSASSVSGTLSAGEVKKIAVTIDRSKLNSGSHSGSFKVNDETISVSADVAEVVGSKFEVTPTILPFGLAFTSLDLQVSNAGGGTVDYSITGLPNYLSASSVSGTLSAGEVKKIAVTIDRSK